MQVTKTKAPETTKFQNLRLIEKDIPMSLLQAFFKPVMAGNPNMSKAAAIKVPENETNAVDP